MQIAALKPQYTSDSEVSAEYIEHEKEILMAQIQNAVSYTHLLM